MVDVIDKDRQALHPTLRSLLDKEAAPDNKFVYCIRCSHLLARAGDAIKVSGHHQHFCTNPYGIDFDVCCYRQALGCTISGQPTGADSWFPGYTWRFATCTGCEAHLGWLFETTQVISPEHFYGLIAERIQIDEERKS